MNSGPVRSARRGGLVPGRAVAVAGARGFTLIEMLVYMSIWLVIVGFGFALFYRAMTSSRRQAQSGDAVVQVVQAGERWRADVRKASGAVGFVPGEDGDGWMLHLPSGGGGVDYRFTGTNVLRRAGGAGPWVEVVSRVRSSEMVQNVRGDAGSWRWELELAVRDNPVRVRPLFTFLAVPGGRGEP